MNNLLKEGHSSLPDSDHPNRNVSPQLGASLGTWTRLLLVAATIVCFSSPLIGQQSVSDQRTELGVRQKLVQRKMVELEAKFTIVAGRIAEKDPNRAELLIKTYQQSKQSSLTKKMENVSDLLNNQNYDAADQELDEVVDILESLIRMLTNEKEKSISAKDEIEMLEQFKQAVQQQLQEQRQQTRETGKAANKEQASNQVQIQIKALNQLIEEQTKLLKETQQNKNANLKKLDNIADRQFEIRKQTDRLKDDVAGVKKKPNLAGPLNPPSDSKSDSDETNSDADVPPNPNRSADPQRTDAGIDSKESKTGKLGKPEDRRLAQKTPPQSNPSADKPSDGKPSDGESSPSSSSPSDESPDVQDPQSPNATPTSPPQPGQRALEKSAQAQQRAEEKLGSGQPADAKRQQETALEELKNALEELEKEKRRIESLPPEILEQLAKAQRRSRDKTMDLIKAMEKSPKGKPSSDNQDSPDGDSSPPAKQPGQQQMEQAGEAQQQAAQNMEQNNTEEAQKQQQQAQQKMQQALEEIEDRLSQLREETNEEKLARLETRFREMLDRQKVASVMTTEIEDKRSNLGSIRLRDQLLILRLATEELEIRELAQQAYDLLLEDGTSIVFPEVVQDIRTDLQKAANLLQSERTDQYTQLIQKEIEITIQDLLSSLDQAKQAAQQQSQSGQSNGGGGKQPLLKKSAELKILRMQQRRLNRRTKKLEIMSKSPAVKDVIDTEISDAAAMQKKILDMTDNIMKKK
jgi:hypothetical protein